MKDSHVSKIYARSIYDLALEQKIDATKEIQSMLELINSSNHLENLLFLEVFSPDEKWSVLSEVFQKMGTSSLLKNFFHILVSENRINLLPLVMKDIIVIDDHEKGFLRGNVEGAEEEISSEAMNQIKSYIQSKLGVAPVLSYTQNHDISAGHKITVGDLQLDASLENQLKKFQESIVKPTL